MVYSCNHLILLPSFKKLIANECFINFFFFFFFLNIIRVVMQIPEEILNNADLQDAIRRVNINAILYSKVHVHVLNAFNWYSQDIKPDTILNFVMCGAVQKLHCVPLCDRCLRNFMFEFIIFVFF